MKILLLVLILSMPYVASSQDINGYFESGYDIEDEWYYTDLSIACIFNTADINNIIWGGVETYFMMQDMLPSSLLRAVYKIGYRIEYRNIYAGIDHFCNHPIIDDEYEAYINRHFWTSSGTKIKIGVKW